MSRKFNALLLTIAVTLCLMVDDSQQIPLTRFGRGSLPRYGKRFVRSEEPEEVYYFMPDSNYICEYSTETEAIRCLPNRDVLVPRLQFEN